MKYLYTVMLMTLLTACGGGSGGNSGGNNNGPAGNTNSGGGSQPTAPANVIGATSEAACEGADDDLPACFIVDGTQARMFGVLGATSLQVINTLISQHPDVSEILMVNVPGSFDDEVNVQVGRALNNAGINTRLEANSRIASGGVDFFLAGIERVVIAGAEIGVHSWSVGNVEGADLPRNDPQHNLYLDYYRDINFAQGEEFYFFTLAAAPSNGIHNMTAEEIERFNLATPVSQTVSENTVSSAMATVNRQGQLGEHQVMIEQSNTMYITGDDADTTFSVSSGVNHIDGGAGQDALALDGPRQDYMITVENGQITVADSYFERDGISVITNIESIAFEDTTISTDTLVQTGTLVQ